ncbi:MAG: hypothetical protein ACTSUE_16345 [Promethearchaeota archaeon]
MNNQDKLLSRVVEVKDRFMKIEWKSNDLIFIFTHHDADGISAASILGRTLMRLNMPFQIRVIKNLTEFAIYDVLNDVDGFNNKFFIFIDIGSGQLKLLLKKFERDRILVLDHHEIAHSHLAKSLEHEGFLHLNPWLFDLDGSKDVSSAGLAYFFSKSFNVGNVDLAPLAIVGALGDEQDVGENSSLVGLNRRILDDCKMNGLVKESVDIKIFGRFTRPIHLAISGTIDPYLPGLSGDDKACLKFLERIGIPSKNPINNKFRTISVLSKEEKGKLVSGIIERALKYGMNPAKVRGLIGTIYLLEKEPRNTSLKDMREFASLLNSCGRMGRSGVGISIAMGNREEFLLEGQKLVLEFTKKLANYMDWVMESDGIKRQDSIQVVEGSDYIDDTMLTTLTLLLMSSRKVDKRYPIVAWAMLEDDMESIKISARSEYLVKKGLDLGKAFREVVKEIGIETIARGHAPAASVEIPAVKLEKFLRFLARKVNAQLGLGPKPTMNLGTWL